MTEPTAQLLQIRLHLNAREIHLCRMGTHQEWIALGLPLSPSLRYSGDRWVCSHESLKALVTQALGGPPHEPCDRRHHPARR